MKKLLALVIAIVGFAGTVLGGTGGGIYSPTIFYRDVSVGLWTSTDAPSMSPTNHAAGGYLNGTFTRYYRINGTNRAGRLPTSPSNSVTFNANPALTNAFALTNAVSISWTPYDGVRSFVIERSEDGANFTNWIAVSGAVTNFIDRATNDWNSGNFSTLFPTTIPEPDVPWVDGTVSNYWKVLGPSRLFATSDVPNHEVLLFDEAGTKFFRIFDSAPYGSYNDVEIGENATADGASFAAGEASTALNASFVWGYLAEANANSISIGDEAFSVSAVALGGGSFSSNNSVSVGRFSDSYFQSVSVGETAIASNRATVVGYGTKADGIGSAALGFQAQVQLGLTNTIQLGQGENTTENTLQFGSKTLMNSAGQLGVLDGSQLFDVTMTEVDPLWTNAVNNVHVWNYADVYMLDVDPTNSYLNGFRFFDGAEYFIMQAESAIDTVIRFVTHDAMATGKLDLLYGPDLEAVGFRGNLEDHDDSVILNTNRQLIADSGNVILEAGASPALRSDSDVVVFDLSSGNEVIKDTSGNNVMIIGGGDARIVWNGVDDDALDLVNFSTEEPNGGGTLVNWTEDNFALHSSADNVKRIDLQNNYITNMAYSGDGAGLTNLPIMMDFVNGWTNQGTLVQAEVDRFYVWDMWTVGGQSANIVFTNSGVQLASDDADGWYLFAGQINISNGSDSQDIHGHIFRGNNGVTNEIMASLGTEVFLKNKNEFYQLVLLGTAYMTNSQYVALYLANETSGGKTLTASHNNFSMIKISD